MTLLGWELKKLLKHRLTRVLLGLCLVLVTAEPLALGFANLGFGTQVASPTWESRTRVVQATADAAAWHGPLTPAVLRAAREDCRAVLESGGRVDGQTAFVQGDILYTAAEVMVDAGILPWQDWAVGMTALDDDTLTAYDALWQQAADRQIAAAPAAWQDTLRALKDRVAQPFTYDWTAGHESVLAMLGNIMFLVGLLLSAAVLPLFCGEVRTRVYTVSHCARRGRGTLAAAKLAAALLFAGGAFAVCMGVFVAVQLAMFGSRALSASLQIADFRCLFPLTLGQAEALLLGAGLLSCLAATALAAALSAAFDGEFPALAALVGILVFLRGLIAAGFLAGPLDFLLRAVPFLAGLSDLTGNALLTLPGGRVLPALLYQMAVQPLWLVVLLPLAGRAYVRRPHP